MASASDAAEGVDPVRVGNVVSFAKGAGDSVVCDGQAQSVCHKERKLFGGEPESVGLVVGVWETEEGG